MNSVNSLSQKIASAYRFLMVYGQHLPLAAKAIFRVHCTISTIHGSLRDSGTPITLSYVGRHWNYDFLTNLMFERHEVVSQESVNLFAVRSRLKRLKNRADVEIVDIGWPYNERFKRDHDYVECPDWINMVLPLADDWDSTVRQFRSTTRNNDLRLIRRNKYRFEVTNSAQCIESFHDEMYLPTVKKRHGIASIVAPRKHVLRRAQQGALLQIFKGDQLVIAGVIYPENGIMYFLWQGAPERYQEAPPEGAVSALYFFGIRYAFDDSMDAVDFAGTRAFLNFGDFRFKRKWGSAVDDSFSPSAILIRLLNNNKNTITFVEKFPVIARSDDGLEAVIVRRGDTVNNESLKRLEKQYNCDGLVRCIVINVSDSAAPLRKTVVLGSREFEVIECHPDHLSSCYVSR